MRHVALNRRSAWLSCFYLANLVCMPFVVYLSEVLPFATVHRQDEPLFPFPLAPALTHTLAQQYVARFQSLYNATTLPRNKGYFYDSDRVVDVMRTAVSPSDCGNPSTLLNGMLGVAYFTPDAKSAVLGCVCGNLSAADVGRAWRLRLIAAPSSVNVVWVQPGNTLNGHMGASYTVHYLFIPDKMSSTWLTIKFIYRALLSLAILGLAMRSYYRHVGHLCTNLVRFPLQPLQLNGSVTRYEVVIGEPSPLIMANPYVCLAFIADILATSEHMGQACLRLCQTQSLLHFVVAMVYLGRLVWCAYGTLVVHNVVRKRKAWAALASAVDSTQVAVLVYFVGGFLTFVQALWPALIKVYTWLFCLDSTAAPDAPDHRLVDMNIVLVIAVYLMTICCTPYVVSVGTHLTQWLFPRGIGYSCRKIRNSVSHQTLAGMRSPPQCARPATSVEPAPHAVLRPPTLMTPNDTKGYIRQWLCPVKGDVACVGGSMYQVFRWHPGLFQVQGTISQTSSDCFVCGYDASNTLVEVVCVSLVSQVNLSGHRQGRKARSFRKQFVTQHAAVADTWAKCRPSEGLAVGKLVAKQGRDNGAPSVVLQQGANKSPWIM